VLADCISYGGDSCARVRAVETCKGREGTFRSSMISSLPPPPPGGGGGFDASSYQRFAPPTGAMRRDGFHSEPQLPSFDGEVTI